MTKYCFKIYFFSVIVVLLTSCNSVKRVADGDYLLENTSVTVDGKKNNSEEISNLLFQKPNKRILFNKLPLRLYVYNWARPNIDSIVYEKANRNPKRKKRQEKFLSKKQYNRYLQSKINFNKWLKKTGEAPVIVQAKKTQKSVKNLKAYYFNNGWFNAEVTAKTDTISPKKATVTYNVLKNKAYTIDSLQTIIDSPALDSIYQATKNKSFITKTQYRTEFFDNEIERLTSLFRNSGAFRFSQEYINFSMDTINTNHKVNVDLLVTNEVVKIQDSVIKKPFSIYTVKNVNIYTNSSYQNREKAVTDSLNYKNYNLFSIGKLRYHPKALTDAVFITPKQIYKEKEKSLTYKYLSNLKTFKYPNIVYKENNDSTLTANIYLTPLKRFSLDLGVEVSQSNIQSIGIGVYPSLLMRNVFRGAETLQFTASAAIGASKDAANDNDNFFDILELGADLNLTIPRIFFPINTNKIIPKSMLPKSRISLGLTSQTNVGLDKQTFQGLLNYNWKHNNKVTNSFDFFNIQYIKNLNTNNYFGIYSNSYNRLNDIAQTYNNNPNNVDANGNLIFPEGTNQFINEVLSNQTNLNSNDTEYITVNNINSRKQRLTEDNFIVASAFNYTKDSRTSIYENRFSIFRTKLELAGNLLNLLSKTLNAEKNEQDRYEIFGVTYSQYIKTELDFINHWSFGKENIFALRAFFGIAVPLGNASNIPFSKSFFGGGPNDNRAWTAYSLGPGSYLNSNEFNEANLKLALSLEQRFNIFGSLNGAVFLDAGNIWNIFDDTEIEAAKFNGLQSLKDTAIGTGFGLRYDFGFLVFRLDIGFKTFNPSNPDKNKWFTDFSLRKAVYNIGINYPF